MLAVGGFVLTVPVAHADEPTHRTATIDIVNSTGLLLMHFCAESLSPQKDCDGTFGTAVGRSKTASLQIPTSATTIRLTGVVDGTSIHIDTEVEVPADDQDFEKCVKAVGSLLPNDPPQFVFC
jgi:hypothetical protein